MASLFTSFRERRSAKTMVASGHIDLVEEIEKRKATYAEALVAASTQIKVNDPVNSRIKTTARRPWQKIGFTVYDIVGEVKYAINYNAWLVSKILLVPARLKIGERTPTPIDGAEAEPVLKALRRIQGPFGGHSKLLNSWAKNLHIAGECYLVGFTNKKGVEEWSIKSIEQVERKDGKDVILDGDRRVAHILGDNDFIIRMHMPHPLFDDQPDSPLRGVLSQCEDVLLLEQAARAVIKSRLAGSGILKVPSELSFGAPQPSEGAGTEEEPELDPFLADLMEAMTAPLSDEGAASAVVPLVVKGPAEFLRELQHLSMDRPFDEQIDTRTARAIRRLAQGLNIPPEVIMGLEGINHWSAWQIEESSFKAHVEPLVSMMCEDLTVGYLWPYIYPRGIPKDKDLLVISYDPVNLIVRPNKNQETFEAHDRICISDEQVRRDLGYTEESAPDEDEMLRRTGLKRGTFDPELTAEVLRLVLETVDVPVRQPDVPSTQNQPAPVSQKPNKGEVGPPEAVKPAVTAAATTYPVWLHERLVGAVDAAIRRSYERAGARLRTNAQKDRQVSRQILSLPNSQVASALGKDYTAVVKLTDKDLLDGGLSELKNQFYQWTDKIISSANGQHNDVAKHRDEAWRHLDSQLSEVLKDYLYVSSPPLENVVVPAIRNSIEMIMQAMV